MVEEISLSIEETNKLRASIGLPPIPIPQDLKAPKREQKSQTSVEISLEETNRLRLSLGLKPIPIDTVDQEPKEKEEIQNFRDHESKIEKEEKESRIRQKLNDSRAKALKRRKLLQSKTLFDGHGHVESTDEWLNRLGKEKSDNKPKTKIKLLIPDDELVGLKIGHNLKELSTLEDKEILTLKDVDILADDEDGNELNNETLLNNAKMKKEVKERAQADNIKENGRLYRGFQSSEEREDVKTPEDDHIELAGSTIYLPNEKRVEPKDTPHTIKIDNMFSDDEEYDNRIKASDYSEPKRSIKMKKLKRKTSKPRSKLDADEEITLKNVELDKLDENKVTEEDMVLQSVLSLKRRLKQKNLRKNLTPEQIANEVKQVKRWEAENDIENKAITAQANMGGIIYNDTSDFLNSMNTEVLTQQRASIKQEQKESNIQIETMETKIKNKDGTESENGKEISSSETPVFSGGLAATLNFLQSRNIIHKPSNDKQEQERKQRETSKEAELLKLKISIEERLLREELRADKHFIKLPKSEREEVFQNCLDQRLKEKNIFNITPADVRQGGSNSIQEKLENYNPQVKLSYTDEAGNEMTTKEAFKYLSHQFHGVGPGKNKIDKKLKKVKEERDKNSLNSSII